MGLAIGHWLGQVRSLSFFGGGQTIVSPLVTLDDIYCTTRCPQGHTYVIGECGGAMQAARCPECGSGIGGTGHTLDSTNTREDVERLVHEAEEVDAHRAPAQPCRIS